MVKRELKMPVEDYYTVKLKIQLRLKIQPTLKIQPKPKIQPWTYWEIMLSGRNV
jgi:hypothetical protein